MMELCEKFNYVFYYSLKFSFLLNYLLLPIAYFNYYYCVRVNNVNKPLFKPTIVKNVSIL